MDVFKAIHTVAVPFLVALCTCETVRPISIVFFRYFSLFPTIPMASKSTSVTAKVIPPSSQSSTDQFATLLAAIKQSETRLDQKLVAFRSDLKEAQEEAATKAANRVRLVHIRRRPTKSRQPSTRRSRKQCGRRTKPWRPLPIRLLHSGRRRRSNKVVPCWPSGRN